MGNTERNRLLDLVGDVIPFVLTFGVLAVLVTPTFVSVASRWLKFNESYSHGFLLLAVSLLIVAKKWNAGAPVSGFYPCWLFPLVLALVGYTVGGILRVEALQELVLIPLILSALAILVGWNQGRKFILPIGVLVFAMPFWDYISWPLQLMTVAVNEIGLGLLGIDFRIEGVYVFLTGIGAFEVAHGCSGLRYLLVGQSLALLYGELNLRAIRSRVILYLAAVALSLFANWLRVFVIIYMGYETNMQSSLIAEHDNFGWWVFAGTLIPLFLLGRRLEKTDVERAADGLKITVENDRKRAMGRYFASFSILTLSIIALVFLPSNEAAIRGKAAAYDFGLDGKLYSPVFASSLEGWRPQIQNPDRMFQQTLFRRSSSQVSSLETPVIYYASIHSYDFQRQDAEVIQYFNKIYDSGRWKVKKVFDVLGAGNRALRGVTLESRGENELIHVAYGYYVEGFWESDEVRAKLAQLKGFYNSRTDASLLAFGVSCEDCEGPEALKVFINENLPVLISEIDKYYLQ